MASQKRGMRWLLVGVVAAALSGCVSVPDAIKGTSPTPQDDLVRVMNAPNLYIGQEVTRGERFGFIRFGSRVDVYVPLNSEVLVFVGQKVRAADTVLALLNPQEEEKPETPVEAPAVEAVEVTEVAATADAALAAETKTTEEKTQQQA